MSEYFLEPNYLGGKVKVELDLSNHATKGGLKNATGVHTSPFTIYLSSVDKLEIHKFKNVSTNFRNFKRKVDKLDVDKLVPVPADLS